MNIQIEIAEIRRFLLEWNYVYAAKMGEEIQKQSR